MYKTSNPPNYLCQGDIILEYHNEDLLEYSPKDYFKGILILSYTCDLKWKKLNYISVCPIYSFEYLIELLIKKLEDGCNKAKNRLNCIKKTVIKFIEDEIFNYKNCLYFFLKTNDCLEKPLIADLQQISNISIKYYEELFKNRNYSLDNPWIEKLGYMIGENFNKVAVDELTESEKEILIKNRCIPIIEIFLNKTNENNSKINNF